MVDPRSTPERVGEAHVVDQLADFESMLTLYSYPELFGVADNNGYGLKV
jgi:hypothetical protein